MHDPNYNSSTTELEALVDDQVSGSGSYGNEECSSDSGSDSDDYEDQDEK